MKVLIGTPIHESKDYSAERWLKSVSLTEYPADFLIVDNSPGLEYVEKLKSYCAKYGITNYKIEHLEIAQGEEINQDDGEQTHERIARSREIIRQEFLSSDYDAYFFWESDILLPPDALGKLVNLMQAGDFMVVDHNCWISNVPNHVNFDYGIVLFSRKCLEKYTFLNAFTDEPDSAPSWYEAEFYFRKKLYKDNCKYTEVEGLIEPVYHLNK